MRCSRVRKLLMPYHDGELPLSRRSQINEHLLMCSDCTSILEDLERADSAATVPDPGPEYWSSFTNRVMQSVDKLGEEKKHGIRLPVRERLQNFWRLAPALSAALVLVVAAGLLLDIDVRIKIPGQSAPGEKLAVGKTVTEADRIERYDADDMENRARTFAMKEEKPGLRYTYRNEEPKLVAGADLPRSAVFRDNLTAEPSLESSILGHGSVLDLLDKNLAGGELVLIQVLNYRSTGDVIEMRALKTDLSRSGLADRALMLRDTVSTAGDPELTTLLNDLALALRDLESASSDDLSGVQSRIRKSGLLERTADYRVLLSGGR